MSYFKAKAKQEMTGQLKLENTLKFLENNLATNLKKFSNTNYQNVSLMK